MALGVIAPLCASLGPVLAGPEGCSRGRWRSGPSKWRHTAALGGRGQGAPRTCRCIETNSYAAHEEPRQSVREHHAPVGALRRRGARLQGPGGKCQGAPRTCRCIETPDSVWMKEVSCSVREHHAPVGALRPGRVDPGERLSGGQGAPRTCRCIETPPAEALSRGRRGVREHHAPVGALRRSTLHHVLPGRPVREHHAPVGALSFSRQGWWRGVGVAGAVFCGVRVGPGSRMAGFRDRTAGPDGRGSGSAVDVRAESRFRAGRALSGACLVVW